MPPTTSRLPGTDETTADAAIGEGAAADQDIDTAGTEIG